MRNFAEYQLFEIFTQIFTGDSVMKYFLRIATLSSLFTILSLGYQPANAVVKFLGIGNDNFANDINVSSNALSPFLGTDDIINLHFNLNGAQILQELTNAKNMLQNGDVFIFHYSGHGDAPGIPDLAPIDENNPGNNGDEGVIGLVNDFPPLNPIPRNPADENLVARDDEIAMIINMIPESVGVLSIFDNCYAGEMIDGTADINRGLVIGTSDADCRAPGDSIFLPEWLRSLSSNGMGSVVADANNDQNLTLGELFNSLSLITTRGHVSNPYAANFETETHLNYTVAFTPVPEPTSILSLFALGTLGAGATLKRKLKRSKTTQKVG